MPRKKLKRDPTAQISPFSKNLLSLKFMQRRQVGAELEDKLEQIGKQKCIENKSYFFCEGLRFGRFSFKGQNLEIEAMAADSSATVQKKRRAETTGNKEEEEDDDEEDNEVDNIEED